jgi:hypothetical protein
MANQPDSIEESQKIARELARKLKAEKTDLLKTHFLAPFKSVIQDLYQVKGVTYKEIAELLTKARQKAGITKPEVKTHQVGQFCKLLQKEEQKAGTGEK